ncbi:MAG: trigger factor [Bacilli bacterium]|nr:trigger factor [Bacilli bacterium]
MKQTLNKIDETKVELVVTADEAAWVAAQQKAVDNLCKEVTIKGFRKGEAPKELARRHVNGNQAIDDAVNSMLPSMFAYAVGETKIRPFTRPEVAITKLNEKELEIKFTVILVPEVELGAYKGLTAEKEAPSVTEEEINDAIIVKLQQAAELKLVEREAKKGDTINLDFEGFVDGVAFEGGKAENYALELGSNSFVPGFEDQLIGVKAGESRDIEVTFPTAYVENLAGKKATFKCKVHEVKEKCVPDLTDEAVKDMGIKDVETVEALKESEKNRILNQKLNQANQAYWNAIVEQIVAGSKISINPTIIENEAKQLAERMKQQVEQNGLTMEQYLQITGQKEEDLMKQYNAQAEHNIKVFLCLEKVGEVEKLTVTEEEINAECQKIADQYKMELKAVKDILCKEGDNRLAEDLRQQKISQFILANNLVGAAKKAPAKKAAAPKAEKAEKPAAEKKPAAKKAPAKKAAAKKAE